MARIEVRREPGESVDEIHARITAALVEQADAGTIHVSGDAQQRYEQTVDAVLEELDRARSYGRRSTW